MEDKAKLEQQINDMLQRRCFLINVKNKDIGKTDLELYSLYFDQCQKIDYHWLSFNNEDMATEVDGKLTAHIEGTGELEIDTNKIKSITKLNEDECTDMFDFGVSMVYRISLFKNANYIDVGFMD